MTRTCRKCLNEQPIDEFYRHPGGAGGRKNTCRTCFLAAAKARSQVPEVRRARSVYLSDTGKGSEYSRRYANTDKGRARLENSRAKQRESGKRRAYRAVDHAIAMGRLARTGVCSCCGVTAKTHMHHHAGYNEANWLNVIEVCHNCHAKEHQQHANL